MTEPYWLDEPDEYGDRPMVVEWDAGGGIDIDAPGCGTASLNDERVERLRLWLNRRKHEQEVEANVDRNYQGELYGADPNCEHEVLCAPGGGVKCRKCSGWFCY